MARATECKNPIIQSSRRILHCWQTELREVAELEKVSEVDTIAGMKESVGTGE